MHYQIKPEIKIGRLSDIIPTTESLGNVLILTSKSLNKIHRIQDLFRHENCEIISSVEPELPFSYIRRLYQEITTRQRINYL